MKLTGKIIINTRPLAEDDNISSCLTQMGAELIHFPLIKILPTEDNAQKDFIFRDISAYKHIVFTSKNGVKYFFDYLNTKFLRKKLITDDTCFYVIGKTTAEELKQYDIANIFVCKGNTSEDFVQELESLNFSNQKILLALGNKASDLLEKKLQQKNVVQRVDVYKTQFEENISIPLVAEIKQNRYSIIIFTSPSGIENFAKIMQSAGISQDFRIACIGEITKRKALEYKIVPLLTASKPDGKIFANEIRQYILNH